MASDVHVIDQVEADARPPRGAGGARGEGPEGERTAIDDRLAQAGATGPAHAALTDAWYDPDVRSFRSALVGLLLENLDPAPADGATLDEQLAQALVQGLTGADPASPDALTADAANVLAILSQGDNPMITLEDQVVTGADAVVVLGVPVEPAAQVAPTPTPGTDDAASDDVLAAQIAVLTQGGPGTSTTVLVYYLYQQAFQFHHFGYGATLSILLFVIVLALTVLQWQMRKRWVFHES